MKFKAQFTDRFRELLNKFQAINGVPDLDQSEISIKKDITPVVYVPSKYELVFKDIFRLNSNATPGGVGLLWYDTGLSVNKGECWNITSCIACKAAASVITIAYVLVSEAADTDGVLGGGNTLLGASERDILRTVWVPEGVNLFLGAYVAAYTSGDVIWRTTIERYTYKQNTTW